MTRLIDIIEASVSHGQGTKVAEYIESKVPRDCGHCKYLKDKNLCRQKEMLKDSEVPTCKETGLKIVNPKLGCCRYWEAK